MNLMKKTVYLDNAATTQKPKIVINSIKEYYEKHNANVHRGLYKLSQKSTELYEGSRNKIKKFVNAEEVIFTKNATEGINLVAYGLKPKTVVTTILEHHSNFVPWQQIAKNFKVAGIKKDYTLNEEELISLVTKQTELVAITYVSNAIGIKNNVKKIINKIKKKNKNTLILVDATQAVQNFKVDMKDLGCDYLVFSGHKMYGPTGIGILAGTTNALKKLSPFNYGGEMIKEVTIKKTTYNEIPHKFEAGTPNISGAIALSSAIDYIKNTRGTNLVPYLIKELKKLGITVIGKNQVNTVSFVIKGIHPHDIASILDEQNIAIRAGHHCAQPLMNAIGVSATARVSFAKYNTKKDVDKLIIGLKKVLEVFK